MNIVKVLNTTLKSSLAANGATITVQAFVDSNGDEVTLGDFGTFFVVVLRQGSKFEIIKCDGITQSVSTDDSTAVLDIATSGRNILPKPPYTGSSTGKAFQTTAEVIITNDPLTMSLFAQADLDNAFTGANTFAQFPKKSGSTTPVDPEDFVTLAYMNSVVLGDATTSAIKSSITFGEDVTDGDPVYFKESDGKWWRAYANDPATCIGTLLAIADETAVADAIGIIVRSGRKVNLTGMTVGENYLTDAGGISTTPGSYVVHLGTAVSATTLSVDIKDGDREQFLNTITGMLVPFASDTTPSGFLTCDGSLYNFTAYPDLLNVIGVKYGLGSGVPFTVTPAADTIDIVSHGFSDGKLFYLSTSSVLPGGLSSDTKYYVVNAATNTFQLSLTLGGTPVDITDAGSGTQYLHTQFAVPDLRGSSIIGSGQKTLTFTFVDADVVLPTDTITIDSNDFLHTGQSVSLSTSGTLPAGLSATTYYIIRVSATEVKLATTLANANAGTAVDITGAGTGTHTITFTLTNRTVGEYGGEEGHQLSEAELASHTHGIISGGNGSGVPTNAIDSDNGLTADKTTRATGDDALHNNMPPYMVANWIIKT